MGTILIVDEDKGFAGAMAQLLGPQGHTLFVVETGAQALRKVEEDGTLEAILVDPATPGVIALDLIAIVRKQRPDIPMIVVSSGTTPRSALAALREGAFDFLEKSADPEVVLQILSRALEYHMVSRSDLTRMRQLDRLKASALEIANLIRWDTLGQFLKDHGLLYQKIVDLIAMILQVEIVSLMLVNESNRTLRIAYAKGLDAQVIATTRKRVGEGVAGWVASEGEPLLIKDIGREGIFGESSFYPQYSTKSLMSVPIKVNGQVAGVLNANNKISGGSFTEYDLALFTTFACLVSLSFANAQLYEKLSASVEELVNTARRLPHAPPRRGVSEVR